jgi:hypothetical protein
MAIAFIQEFAIADRSTTNYDFVKERLGDDLIDGLIIHTAGFDDDNNVFRILDVWESREQAERFLSERIQPMMDEGPQAFPNPESFAPPTREGFYELHDLVKS